MAKGIPRHALGIIFGGSAVEDRTISDLPYHRRPKTNRARL